MKKIALLAVMMLGFTSSTFAMEGPKVEYSADSTFETEEVSMKKHVNYARGKMREEMAQGGQKQVVILRHDKKVMWMLMPAQNMYMENALNSGDRSQSSDLSNAKVEATEVGAETINGVKTKKLKVIVTTDKGKMGGFFWKTPDEILVKSDLIAIDKGNKMRMKTELTNLKVGPQDPALFEIPAGYRSMSMGAMMGGMGRPR